MRTFGFSWLVQRVIPQHPAITSATATRALGIVPENGATVGFRWKADAPHGADQASQMLTQDERAEEAQRRQAPVRHAVRPPKENMFRGPSNRRCNNHVLTFEDGGTGGAQRASWRRYRQAAGAQRGRRGGGRREHLPAPAPEEQMQGVRGASICPHQRQRDQCKECGGASLCLHQRQRSTCKECRVPPIVGGK